MPRAEWWALGPLDWASIVVVVALGWAALAWVGVRLTRLMPWYGRAIVWTYLVACALGGTWFLEGVVTRSLWFSGSAPSLGQLIGSFFGGALLWPLPLGWAFVLGKR